MELAIEKTDENPYLQRKEVHGKVTFTGATPSNKQFADALATKLSSKADAIAVQHIYTSFGSQQATFEAHVYVSKEQLEKVVRLGTKAKAKLGKAAPATPAEAPKAEAKPAEAKKEETPAEKAAAKPEAKAAPAEKAAEPKKEEPKKAEA